MDNDLLSLVSSRGWQISTADEELVVKPPKLKGSFAWKQLSLITQADCEVSINEHTDTPITLNLVTGISLELESFNIKSLKIKDDSVPYYFIAGY